MEEMYNTPKEELTANGQVGRDSFIGESGLSVENMCGTLVDGIEGTFENWKPRKRFELFKIN